MLSEVEIKNLKTLNGILKGYRDSMNKAEKEVKTIDEKYKKLAEQEKKDLTATIANCKKEIAFWEKPIIKRYGKSIDELLSNPAESETAEPTDEQEEEVVDDLPFGDEEQVVDEQATEEPEVGVNPVEESAEETVFDQNEAEPKETDEPQNEETTTTEESSEDNWPEEESKESTEKKEEDDDWGFPQEW